MIDLIVISLVVYTLTFLAVSSNILHPIRLWIVKHTPFLIVNRTHPLSCRMCAGWWLTIVVCVLMGEYSIVNMLCVYGLSYFIATQERR